MKNAAIFIEHVIKDGKNTWYFAISQEVEQLLLDMSISIDDRFYVFKNSPSKNRKSRKNLLNISQNLKVDLVYTMAGPAYVKFGVPHVMGVSNPYLTHARLADVIKFKSTISLPIFFLRFLYKSYYLRLADYYLFQTSFSEKKFLEKHRGRKTYVIPNAIDMLRFNKSIKDLQVENAVGDEHVVRVFVPGAEYDHKCIHLIVDYADYLRRIGVKNFVFACTLKEDHYEKFIGKRARRYGVEHMIMNLGTVPYVEISKQYLKADIVLIPSLLETFSATYLEAQQVQKPLIVANRGFATEVCGDNAKYIEPFDVRGVVKALTTYNEITVSSLGLGVISQDERCNLIIRYLSELALSINLNPNSYQKETK